MRNYTLLASAIGLALSANLAAANDYNFEINAGLGKASLEVPLFDEQKISSADVSGTYYFSGVNTRNHPYAEAAFLERASNITVTYSNDRWKFNDSIYSGSTYLGDGSVTVDNSITSAEVEFYIPNSIFYLGGGIAEGRSKASYKITVDGETERDSYSGSNGSIWTLRAGVAPIDGLLVWSEFFEDQKLSDEWNLNAKYVMNLGSRALNLEAAYEADPDEDIVFVAADYYFNRSFSLGGMYENNEHSDNNFGVRARKYFTENFAVEASYLASSNFDSVRVGVTARF